MNKRIAIITGRRMASVENEINKMKNTFINKGCEVDIYQFDGLIPKKHYDLGIFWTPFVTNFLNHIRKWIYSGIFNNRLVFYFVIEGIIYSYSLYNKMLVNQYVITPSNFAKSNMEDMKIMVKEIIPHQIDKDMTIDHEYGLIWRSKLPKDKKILLYNGSQIIRKGLPKLREAINILSKKRNDFVMVFHTDNIRQSYHTPIEQLKGPNTVIETDFPHLPLNKVYAKMYYSDIIVHPAITEGFGLPILESFNLSKPLVCVNAPGVNELANDKNSFMVMNVKPKIIDVPLWIKFKAVDYDAKDLAYQIELAMDSSKEVLEDKIKNGLETVKRYYNTYDRFTEI